MKAGKTEFEVDARVKITHIASGDQDDKFLEGATGKITHPITGGIHGDPERYIAGVWLDDTRRYGNWCNLMRGDTVEAIEDGKDNG